MPTVVVSTIIPAGPETVAAVLLDPDAAPQWTRGLERFEVVDGEPGVPGSVGLAHYVEGRRRYALEDRLLEVEPNRRFLSRIEGGGISATVETTLRPVGTGTEVTLRWEGRGTRLVTAFVLPLLRRRIRDRAEADLAALRALVARRDRR